MAIEKKTRHSARKDAFSSVAIWQLLAFVFLLSFIWLNEIMDLTSLLFGTEHLPFNWYRAVFLTAGVITAAIIAVGHTYEKQRALVKQLVEACLYCHRVRMEDGTWQHVEEYFLNNFPLEIEKGSCPDCQSMLSAVAQKQSAKPDPVSRQQ